MDIDNRLDGLSHRRHGSRASLRRAARITLIVLHGFVALTAIGGGVALVVGSSSPEAATVLTPPDDYLAGSPFDSYLVPGIVLGLVLGSVHVVGLVAQWRDGPLAAAFSAAAGFATLIWIFVQMIYIPFSPLQLAYFAFGLAVCGLVMLELGVLPALRSG